MNYYKQGDAANADKIKAAFESKGISVPDYRSCMDEDLLYFSLDSEVFAVTIKLLELFEETPNYQELELPVKPKFEVGDWVVTDYGKVSQIVSVDKDGDGYTLDDGVYFSGSWCDMYHHWDIQDVKTRILE